MSVTCIYLEDNKCNLSDDKQNCICSNKAECNDSVLKYIGQDFIDTVEEIRNTEVKELFSHYKGRKLIREVVLSYSVAGHCCEGIGDYDYCTYYAYMIELMLRHKFKYINNWDIISAYELMKIMGIEVDKQIFKAYTKAKKKDSHSKLRYTNSWLKELELGE